MLEMLQESIKNKKVHHTYSDIDRQDYQILVEADFLVNLYENNVDLAAKEKTYQQIFKTESGKELFKKIF